MINNYRAILLILLLLSLLSLSWRVRYSNYCCFVLLLYTIFLLCLWLMHPYLEQQNINIKRPIGLKLLRRHTGTLIFKHLMIHFLCIELEKVILSEFFFKFTNSFISTSTATTSNLDDVILVTYFLGLQVQALLMMVYQ